VERGTAAAKGMDGIIFLYTREAFAFEIIQRFAPATAFVIRNHLSPQASRVPSSFFREVPRGEAVQATEVALTGRFSPCQYLISQKGKAKF
jgi:hypothetical protein